MNEKTKIVEVLKIVGLIVQRKCRLGLTTKRMFSQLEAKPSACLMKIKRQLIIPTVKNLMRRVMMRNLEIYLEVKAYIKGKEEGHFIPCLQLILSSFLMMILMQCLKREASLCLKIINSKLVLLAKYIIWQITISSQLQYHQCLGAKLMMIIIGIVL